MVATTSSAAGFTTWCSGPSVLWADPDNQTEDTVRGMAVSLGDGDEFLSRSSP